LSNLPKMTDYHIEVCVNAHIGSEDLSTFDRMIEAWADGLHKLGIPFAPHLARFQTVQFGEPAEYQQLIYGISGTVQPEAKAIHAAMQESLANHGWPSAPIYVKVYRIQRELLDSTGWIRTKGVLTA
jgi:hypothetical protein